MSDPHAKLCSTKGNKVIYTLTLDNGTRVRVITRHDWQDPIGYLRPADRDAVMDVQTVGAS